MKKSLIFVVLIAAVAFGIFMVKDDLIVTKPAPKTIETTVAPEETEPAKETTAEEAPAEEPTEEPAEEASSPAATEESKLTPENSTAEELKKALLSPQTTDVIQGDATAPITIIEYASMSCSHCATFHANTYPDLKENYIDTGKVRFIFRDFPLDEPALRASQISRCAPKENFSKFTSAMFQTQGNWAQKENYIEVLTNVAKLGGMTGDEIDTCLKNTAIEQEILQSKFNALKVLEVNSTPTLFIQGQIHKGAIKYEELSKILDGFLAPQEEEEATTETSEENGAATEAE